MTRPGRYPQELRERAVRMVLEHQDEHPSQWAAICSIANKFGVSHKTLRKWVRTAEVDDGLRAGLTSDERDRLKALERENRELRRANEILKSASAFFASMKDEAGPVGFARFFAALAVAGGLSGDVRPHRAFGLVAGRGLIGACLVPD